MMPFLIDCPHCGKGLQIDEQFVGMLVRCPHCKGTMTVRTPSSPAPTSHGQTTRLVPDSPSPTQTVPLAAPPTTATATGAAAAATSGHAPPPATSTATSVMARAAAGPPHKNGLFKRGGADVNLPLTGLVALAVTVVLYLGVFIPLEDTYVGTLMTKRGYVQHSITLLTCWGLGILLLKGLKLGRQRRCLAEDVLPAGLGATISKDNIDPFAQHARRLLKKAPDSFLFGRVVRALDHFGARGNVQEVGSLMESQAGIDAAAVDSSYALMRVFIWAIPILGFIGTVIGIGEAVGGFSDAINASQAQDQGMEAVKVALGGVTSGLAKAFDTTLLALVMSMFLMFPANAMQKAEENILNRVDEYCNENLLRRLDDQCARAGAASDPAAIRQAVRESFAEQKGELAAWSGELRNVGAALARQAAAGWEDVHKKLQDCHKLQIQQVHDILDATKEERQTFVAEAGKIHESQVQHMTRIAETFGESATRIQGEIAALQQKQAEGVMAFQQHAQEVQQGLAGSASQLAQHLSETRAAHTQEMAAARQSQESAAADALQQIRDLRDELARAQREQVEGLRAAARETVAALGAGIGDVLRSEREAAVRSTSEQLARVQSESGKLVASLVASQQKLDGHVAAFMRLVEDRRKLTALEQSMAANLQVMATADSFKRTLSNLDRNLGRIHTVLDDVGRKADIIWPKEPPTDGGAGGILSRIAGWVRGGKTNG
jgi:biopolymer transport protein ExbB/TolQ